MGIWHEGSEPGDPSGGMYQPVVPLACGCERMHVLGVWTLTRDVLYVANFTSGSAIGRYDPTRLPLTIVLFSCTTRSQAVALSAHKLWLGYE